VENGLARRRGSVSAAGRIAAGLRSFPKTADRRPRAKTSSPCRQRLNRAFRGSLELDREEQAAILPGCATRPPVSHCEAIFHFSRVLE